MLDSSELRAIREILVVARRDWEDVVVWLLGQHGDGVRVGWAGQPDHRLHAADPAIQYPDGRC